MSSANAATGNSVRCRNAGIRRTAASKKPRDRKRNGKEFSFWFTVFLANSIQATSSEAANARKPMDFRMKGICARLAPRNANGEAANRIDDRPTEIRAKFCGNSAPRTSSSPVNRPPPTSSGIRINSSSSVESEIPMASVASQQRSSARPAPAVRRPSFARASFFRRKSAERVRRGKAAKSATFCLEKHMATKDKDAATPRHRPVRTRRLVNR